MNSPKDPEMQQDSQPDAPRISRHRRRVLQAAAAVPPLIGTLRSGAAFANTSGYQCIGRDAARANQTGIQQLSATPRRGDGWLEVPGSRHAWTGTYSDPDPLIEPNSPPSAVQFVTLHFGSQVWLVEGGGSPTELLGLTELTSSIYGSEAGYLATFEVADYDLGWDESISDLHALVYVRPNSEASDLSGGPTLVPDLHGGWQPLTASCWVSTGGAGSGTGWSV